MYIKTKGEEPMKKTLAIMLALIMVLALVPTVAFAAGNTIYVDANNGNDTTGDGTETKPYKTVEAAAKAAVSGDTIMLGEGNYTLYGVSSEKTTKTKDLTFVGQGAEKTFWNIGAEVPDPANYGTEYNGDYSFDGAGTITFRNMTLRSGEANYLGFIRADKTIVENCTVNGKTFYWGYTSATFTKTTFNCPAGDYAVWTYSSPIMTFESCTFNSKGKVINVYTDYGAGKYDITVNFKNCTVNNTGESLKPVLNINDSNMDKFKYVLNIAGDNNVTGVDVDKITCSRLFGFGGNQASNTGRSVVTINGVKVWENGERACAHNGVVFPTGSYNGDKTTQYTDGYKDNAFEIITNGAGGYVKKCKYCGYTEPFYGELSNEIELTRTVMQGQEVNANPKDTYKVNGSSNITVDYTATMDMKNLEWRVDDATYNKNNKYKYNDQDVSPWELLMALALTDKIDDGRTEVILTFKFDNIDLKAFKDKYEDNQNVLELESTMFEMKDVAFGPDNTMTITCKWKENAITDNSTITLKGCGLPVTNDWNGSKQINIENSGCVGGAVYIKYKKPESYAKAISVDPAAANVQVQNAPSLDSDYTIRIPIVGGCADDKFTLYYGGGSSDDSSGDSGHSHYTPTATPVPVIVIPPKTGDMTVWQSILHFLGIK